MLESNLIKEHRPKYNTMLKDDKNYPYIKVTTNEDYPRILLARKMKSDGCRYYGPYTSAGAVNDTIELMRKIFRIRTCSRRLRGISGKTAPVCIIRSGSATRPARVIYQKKITGNRLNRSLIF